MGEPHRGEALICCDQPATAEMLYGASGELVGIGSSFPAANALARTNIWLDVAPAASIALATTSQLRISVDMAGRLKMKKPSPASWAARDGETRQGTEHAKRDMPR